jgi:hypothetical protein
MCGPVDGGLGQLRRALMGSDADFVQQVADQIHNAGDVRYRKMFGE